MKINIIDQINKILDARGISMYKLAQRTNISQSTIRSILKETQNPTLENLITICKALDLELEIKNSREKEEIIKL